MKRFEAIDKLAPRVIDTIIVDKINNNDWCRIVAVCYDFEYAKLIARLLNKENKMPMKSQAQRKKLWATDPELAKEMESKTPKGKKLPKKVKKGKKK